jgi:hypothetical protein
MSPVPASAAMTAQPAQGRREALTPCGHRASLKRAAAVTELLAGFFAAG